MSTERDFVVVRKGVAFSSGGTIVLLQVRFIRTPPEKDGLRGVYAIK